MTRARDLSNFIGSGSFSSTTFTATAGQTVFTIAHTQGFVQVFMNGLLLDLTVDYTSNGSAITLTSAAVAGDEIEVVKYDAFSVGDAVPASGGTFTGSIDASAGLVTPAGHVVQMKRVVVNTVTSTTSNSYVNHMSAQFDSTPTVGNLVIATATVTCCRTNVDNWGSTCAIYINSEGMSSGDTDFAAVGRTSSYPGSTNYGSMGMIGSQYAHNVTSTGHKTITSSHISGGNPTFYFKVSETASQTSYWGVGQFVTTSNYSTDLTSLIIMEVAQ